MKSFNIIDVLNEWAGWHLENEVFLYKAWALATVT